MPDKIPVVKVVIQNQDNEFLIVKEEESGRWELAGGLIEDDEDRFEAARREVKEETELEVSGLEDLVRLELEDDRLIDCYMIYAEEFNGELEVGGDVSKARWISSDEIKEADWHMDSAYNIVPMIYLEDYLETENDYGEGEEIDVVKLLIQNEDGQFLAMQKTAKDKIHSGHKYTLYGRMAGKWELPGGRFKESDNRFDAAKREIEEECGIEIKNLKDVVREEIEEKNSVNVYIIFTRDWDGEVEISKEHQDLTWVSADEYLEINWHQDAGYGYPPMKFLEEYLDKQNRYSGDEVG